VQMMGGAKKILRKSKKLIAAGEYRLAQEILNKLVYAEPDNTKAKLLLADSFEQLGYQQESPSVRNSFLAAALELRNGIPVQRTLRSVGPDVLRALTVEQYFDYLAVLLDSRKAEDVSFKINYVMPDIGRTYAVELSNATLSNIEGYLNNEPDLTITIDRKDMGQIISQQATYQDLAKQGKVKFSGNVGVLQQLKSILVQFDPLFEIMPGTKPAS